MIKYSFKEDTTQRIFRIEEEDAEDENTAESEEVNEILASSVQDDDFEVIVFKKSKPSSRKCIIQRGI